MNKPISIAIPLLQSESASVKCLSDKIIGCFRFYFEMCLNPHVLSSVVPMVCPIIPFP